MKDDEQTVMNKITSDVKDDAGNNIGFPQLKTCGGYEMMRCAPNCRDLRVINSSWNAKDLRSNLGGGQGKIYLRPIQKCLSTQPLIQASQSEVKEKCQMCHQEILVRKLRDHIWDCTEGLASSDENEQEIIMQGTELHASTSSAITPVPLSVSSLTHIQQSESRLVSLQSTGSASHASTLSIPPTIGTVIDTDSTTPPSAPESARLLGDTDSLSNSTLSSLGSIPVVDLTQRPAVTSETEQLVGEVVVDTINYCQQHNVLSPVEILRCFQQKFVTGRAVEVRNVDEVNEGETNFILVDRQNILDTSFDEIMCLPEYRKTLQVQFYGEVCIKLIVYFAL